MKITKRQLRRIIKEERSRVLSENMHDAQAFYEKKLTILNTALSALEAAKEHERMSAMGEDPDLNQIVDMVNNYIGAVGSMVQMGRRR